MATLGSRRSFLGSAGAALGLLRLPRGFALAGNGGEVSLKAAAGAHGRLFGCAVDIGQLRRDDSLRELVMEQANILVAENGMKWEPLRPAVDRFDFVASDALVDFAEQHGMKVRGHNLCWHRQLPSWFAGAATPANARDLLTKHIETVAGRYAGRMHSWDVVNEAILPGDKQPNGLRLSPWLTLAGPEYIELAFRTARKADPKALLAYNEYGIEAEDAKSEAKRAAVLTLLRGLQAKQVPLDALGIQSHIQYGQRYGKGLTDFMAAVRGMGLKIFITEMDVNDRELAEDAAVRDEAVAALYGSYLDVVLAEPAVTCVLTWGITDRHTWLNGEDARADHLPERCLPFGEVDGRPDVAKPAFFAMRKAFLATRPL
jgi:endo-1,4-beta-xylanase